MKEEAAVEDSADQEKCTMLFAQTVANKLRCLLSHPETGLFIAETASRSTNHQEDSNKLVETKVYKLVISFLF